MSVMSRLVNASAMVWVERVLFFLFGMVFWWAFTSVPNTKNERDDSLTFLVGDHCVSDVHAFFEDLERNSNMKSRLLPIHYNNGEYSDVRYVAKMSHPSLDKADLEGYARGAMRNCSTNSFWRHNLNLGVDSVAGYLAMKKRQGSGPLLISVDGNEVTIRSRE